MKSILTTLALATVALTPGFAQQRGLAFSATNDSGTLSGFKDISQSLRLDLSLNLGDQKVTSPESETTQSQTSLGVGLFGIGKLREGLRLYAGGRIWAVTGHRKASRTTTINTEYTQLVQTITSEADLSGFTLSPTLGLEYFLSKSLSIGAEASLDYRSSTWIPKGGADPLYGLQGDEKTTALGTSSTVKLHYYF